MFAWRNLVVMMMAAILPASLCPGCCGSHAPQQWTRRLRERQCGAFLGCGIVSGDFIATQKQPLARIEASGSSTNIDPETLLQFEDQELVLDHGSMAVLTGRELHVRVGCVTVTPVNPFHRHDLRSVRARRQSDSPRTEERRLRRRKIAKCERSEESVTLAPRDCRYASRNHGRKNAPPRR